MAPPPPSSSSATAKKDSSSSTAANEITEKLTPAQSSTLILTYLRRQPSRPYSAVDISANLKNRVTKTSAAKILKDLHERGEIAGCTQGKQSVYHALQEDFDPASIEEQFAQLDAETDSLREETAKLKAEEKDLRAQLRSPTTSAGNNGRHKNSIAQTLSIPDLRVVIGRLEQDKVDLENRLRRLNVNGAAKDGGGPPPVVSVREREEIVAEWKTWTKISLARRRIREELWAEVREIVGRGKEADVKEELGLEF